MIFFQTIITIFQQIILLSYVSQSEKIRNKEETAFLLFVDKKPPLAGRELCDITSVIMN